MAEEIINGSASDQAGSSAKATDPAGDQAGESGNEGSQEATLDEGTGDGGTQEETVPKSQFDALETKLGEGSEELGKLREFYQDISPLLDKLDAQPELAQAIVDGKVDMGLIKAAAEGTVAVKDAIDVTKAHTDVKKDVGTKKYEALDPKEIEKLVNEKVAEAEKNLKQNISDVEDIREFQKRTEDFVASKDDFADFAKDIDKFFKDHPDQDDIKIAYNTVKGEKLAEDAAKKNQENEGEAAKGVAANAAGGAGQNASVINDSEKVDELISGRSNPNAF